MIIWINGAFGSGKTQTAFELHRRMPNSYVYDPENVGFFIRKNIPSDIGRGDFQNFEMWRQFNYTMLKYIDHEYNGITIVPMTIVIPQYFDEIVGKLRADGVSVNHFTLCASKEVLQKRLKSRLEGKNSWASKQIDRCVYGLANDCFKYHLDTDNKSIEEVVAQIATILNIQLTSDTRNKFRKMYDRIKTQISHIR